MDTKPMDWTPERIARLRTLWAQGLCARDIASCLGGVSRDAVLGMLVAAGIVECGDSTRQIEIMRSLGVKPESCRWPVGDLIDPDFHFCGEVIASGSYCEKHSRMARIAEYLELQSD
jgi:GcrA cell cycle regulator